ncbi:3-hydroxyacyl-CoA dehydrogenase NAD-binding domain-containing protein [Herbiconiux moechotypicola]|uniref:3-hydroxyacyl-CoA dehydrogenase NAD-binding domain-containing protein n=1 Tax=Herbiconiux moechotypicola TaxID=637393 RepID=UPI0031D2C801
MTPPPPAAPTSSVPDADAGDTVGVLGAGSIGVAFAVLFARAGMRVRVWDAFPEVFERAAADLGDRLALLDRHGMLGGAPASVAARVTFHADLADALDGAALVQECAPERVDLKRELFARVLESAPADAVLASSSSALTPSTIAGLPTGAMPTPSTVATAEATPTTAGAVGELARRLIVGHPGNPPYLLPVIEVVPSPATDPDVVDRASALYRRAGLRPVLVRREVEGFLFNRLQGAVLREAYALVRDGVASVEDIDEVVRSGLGRRWAFIGPFETVDLNTRGGVESHAAKMGPAYERMGAERGQHDPWTPELVAEVAAQRREALPLDEWDARVRWRDETLLRVTAALPG